MIEKVAGPVADPVVGPVVGPVAVKTVAAQQLLLY